MAVSQDVDEFIRSTFRSVWTLELLSLLRRSPGSGWSPPQLVAALRASDVVVSQGTASLLAAGLIVIEADGDIRYQAASAAIEALAAETEQLYAKRPDLVRRMIVARGSHGITSFANAFRIREE